MVRNIWNKIVTVLVLIICLYTSLDVSNPMWVRIIFGLGVGFNTYELISWYLSYKKNKNKSHTS